MINEEMSEDEVIEQILSETEKYFKKWISIKIFLDVFEYDLCM